MENFYLFIWYKLNKIDINLVKLGKLWVRFIFVWDEINKIIYIIILMMILMK